jgi:hypothetical protein
MTQYASVDPGGIEPPSATPSLRRNYNNSLPVFILGGPTRTCTQTPTIMSRLLYYLSYRPCFSITLGTVVVKPLFESPIQIDRDCFGTAEHHDLLRHVLFDHDVIGRLYFPIHGQQAITGHVFWVSDVEKIVRQFEHMIKHVIAFMSQPHAASGSDIVPPGFHGYFVGNPQVSIQLLHQTVS